MSSCTNNIDFFIDYKENGKEKCERSLFCSCVLAFKKLPDLAFTSFLKTLNDTLLIQITDCGKYIKLSKGLSQEIYIQSNWI